MRPVSFLIRCLSNLISLMDRLNPMRHMHEELLRRSPIIWRSYVLHVLWYLAIAYIGLYLLGSAITVELVSIYSVAELDALRVAIWSAVALGAAYWIIKLKRVPLPDLRLSRILRTLGLYFICLYPMVSLPTAFMIPLTNSIARTIPDKIFYTDLNYMEKYNFGECSDQINEDTRASFNEIANRYGFAARRVSDCNTVYQEKKYFVIEAIPDFEFVWSGEIGMYFNDITYAKEYSGAGDIKWVISKFFSLWIIFISLALSVFLVFLTYSRNSLAPKSGAKISHWLRRFKLPKWPTLLSARNWDRRLLKRRPRAWATRFHVAVFYSSFIVFLVIFAIDIITFLVEILPYNVISGLDEDIVAFGFVILLLIGFVLFLIFFMRNQRRHIRCLDTLNDHVIAISAFFASSMPGLTILVVYSFISAEDVNLMIVEELTLAIIILSFFIFTASSISYLLIIFSVRSVFSSLAYFISAVIILFTIVILFIDDEEVFFSAITILTMGYFAILIIIKIKNYSIKSGTFTASSNILVDLAKYMVLMSTIVLYLIPLTVIYLIILTDIDPVDQIIWLFDYTEFLVGCFIVALTFGHLPVFLFLCRPVYEVLRRAYHLPSEE